MKLLSENGAPAESIASSAFPRWSRVFSMVVSIVLHPLFVPLIGAWLIVETHYFQFAGFQRKDFIQFYGSVIANAVVLPAFTVFLLKQLKFISSVQMHKRQDRIIPYIAIMTFYFWTYLVFKKQIMVPEIMKSFLLGNFIASILGFLSNIQMKTSMHALGMGGLLGLLSCFVRDPCFDGSTPLIGGFFAAGLVGPCRLILGAHTFRELYMGVAFGVFAQLVAFWIV